MRFSDLPAVLGYLFTQPISEGGGGRVGVGGGGRGMMQYLCP